MRLVLAMGVGGSFCAVMTTLTTKREVVVRRLTSIKKRSAQDRIYRNSRINLQVVELNVVIEPIEAFVV